MRAHVLDANGVVINTLIVNARSVDMVDADEYGGGKGWRWTGTELLPPPGPVQTLEERRQAKLEAIRARRWIAEGSGTSVAGVPIRTDEGSQTKIAGAVALFDKDSSLQSIDFEALPNQWVALDAATMTAIGVAVGRHIQACFSRAKALADEVAAASDAAALDAINIDVGWP
jgi:hypothetical protein